MPNQIIEELKKGKTLEQIFKGRSPLLIEKMMKENDYEVFFHALKENNFDLLDGLFEEAEKQGLSDKIITELFSVAGKPSVGSTSYESEKNIRYFLKKAKEKAIEKKVLRSKYPKLLEDAIKRGSITFLREMLEMAEIIDFPQGEVMNVIIKTLKYTYLWQHSTLGTEAHNIIDNSILRTIEVVSEVLAYVVKKYGAESAELNSLITAIETSVSDNRNEAVRLIPQSIREAIQRKQISSVGLFNSLFDKIKQNNLNVRYILTYNETLADPYYGIGNRGRINEFFYVIGAVNFSDEALPQRIHNHERAKKLHDVYLKLKNEILTKTHPQLTNEQAESESRKAIAFIYSNLDEIQKLFATQKALIGSYGEKSEAEVKEYVQKYGAEPKYIPTELMVNISEFLTTASGSPLFYNISQSDKINKIVRDVFKKEGITDDKGVHKVLTNRINVQNASSVLERPAAEKLSQTTRNSGTSH